MTLEMFLFYVVIFILHHTLLSLEKSLTSMANFLKATWAQAQTFTSQVLIQCINAVMYNFPLDIVSLLSFAVKYNQIPTM